MQVKRFTHIHTQKNVIGNTMCKKVLIYTFFYVEKDTFSYIQSVCQNKHVYVDKSHGVHTNMQPNMPRQPPCHLYDDIVDDVALTWKLSQHIYMMMWQPSWQLYDDVAIDVEIKVLGDVTSIS